MPRAELLPLFPLEAVLLPGVDLPLHIFEPRYRRMIHEVMERGSEFGVLLARDGKVEPLGCTAHVKRISQKHPDGRFDIETVGVRRFRTLDVDESEDVLRGAIEYFDDLPGGAPSPELVKALDVAVCEAADLVGVSVLGADLENADSPSFAACALLPLDVTLKQELLGIRSETERVEKLRDYLESWAEQRKRENRLRATVARNGQARSPRPN